MTRRVRTRFAPSPTGYLHIGSARTAVFSWLVARHFGGDFILRIEDTDQERKVDGAIRGILEEFEWFGIRPDEGPSHDELRAIGEYWDQAPTLGGKYGPYIQSLRRQRYAAAADSLIAKGAAYRCDCSAEMLERERAEQMARKETPGYSGYCRSRNVPAETKHVVRFKMPARAEVRLEDAVKGLVKWESVPLKDPVLLKSEGLPTYHLAVVVDDHEMEISHVMRSDEWLPSAPLHVLLYQAFGWELPIFAHLPAVLGTDGKKLSKRTGSTATNALRAEGYLPEALFNFISLIGWNPGEGEEQEVFSRAELIKRFDISGINRAGGVFDYSKLGWMNGIYIRNMQSEDFATAAISKLQAAGLTVDRSKFDQLAPLVQERLRTIPEVVAMLEFLFQEDIERDWSQFLKKGLDLDKARKILDRSIELLSTVEPFTKDAVEAALRPLADEFSIKLGVLLGVVRIAVTGRSVTPPLFESLVALGRATNLKRLKECRALCETIDFTQFGKAA